MKTKQARERHLEESPIAEMSLVRSSELSESHRSPIFDLLKSQLEDTRATVLKLLYLLLDRPCPIGIGRIRFGPPPGGREIPLSTSALVP